MQFKTKATISVLLLASFLTPYASYAFFDIGNFLNTASKIRGTISSFTGSGIPGASGSAGSKVPILDEATVSLNQKEVGTKKISIHGLGSANLPIGVSISWDKLAWGLANMAIHKITKNIVSWIKTGGRDGKPLFITNWEDFLKEVANDASGIFIEQLELTEICQPFKPRLQMLLGSSGGTYRQRAQCTIKDVTRNVENFYRDFKQGGWERWFEITLVPQNNFYGSYYMALEEKLLRESLAVEAKKSEAIAGGGFLGDEDKICVKFNSTTKVCEEFKWVILTPGKTIERQLNDVLAPPSGEKRLEVADEIDEIISAAFTRLLTSIRGKTNSKNEKQGIVSPEPLNKFIKDTEAEIPRAIQQISDTLELPQAIALAIQTLSAKENSLTKTNTLVGALKDISSCSGGSANSRIVTSDTNSKQIIQDIENLKTLVVQLSEGEEELKKSKTIDDVSQLFADLRIAVDEIVSLYDSAVAENNQIISDTESAQSELNECLKTNNE